MNFAIAIDKPLGISSSDVVIKCRNALSKAVGEKIKCGHMGTLDPAADGVLVLGFGKATKLFDYMQSGKKEYVAEFTFGMTTDTLDREGIVTEKDDKLPEKADLERILPDFVGEIDQIPPAYSAVNVNGVRAYKLARKGGEVSLSAKKVKIYSITLLDVVSEGESVNKAKLAIVCGSGTYIRSLCRDIAEKLGCFAYMSALKRTACAGYSLSDAVPMRDFIDDPKARMGVIDGNPINRDMERAARMAKLAYIVNVVVNEAHEVVAAFAGDPIEAHHAGCAYLARYCEVEQKQKADIVITSNGGAPLDQNAYQAVKGLTTAADAAADGAALIICAECADGIGGDSFYKALSECANPEELLEDIRRVPMDETVPDQWQYQILARILEKHHVHADSGNYGLAVSVHVYLVCHRCNIIASLGEVVCIRNYGLA